MAAAKKKNGAPAIIVIAILAIALVAVFYFLSNRSEQIAETKAAVMTPVQEVLQRDLATNYPSTPKELLKYYSEITRCFYAEHYSDEELTELAEKSRELFDDELKANQTQEDYIKALKKDIADYKEDNKSISSYSVSSSTDVEYYAYDGYDWAQLYCIYSVRVATTISPVQEKFLLRRDSEDHWKIVGWQLAKKEEDK